MEIEKSKEILKEFKKYFESEAISRKYSRNISITVGEDDINAIEILLGYIQELEKALKCEQKERMKFIDLANDSIPKQKILNKIEELEDYIKKEKQKEDGYWTDLAISYDITITILKELLGEE